jgi:FkbM family methyltransferase
MTIVNLTRRMARPLAHELAKWIMTTDIGGRSIAAAARLPPRLKTLVLTDVMRILTDAGRRTLLVETNLGISNRLKVLVPAGKTSLAFGRPEAFLSDRGALRLLRVLAPRSGAFVDVGAHEGLYSFFVAELLRDDAAVPIHVFEPDPTLFARLADNLERNSIRATKKRKAAAATPGAATFHRNMSDDSSGSLNADFVAKWETESIEVATIRLADYLVAQDLRSVCMKVDVEGWGAAVWDGLRDAADRVDWLILEITAPEWEAQLPRRVIEETGWFAYYIRDCELQPWSAGSYDYLPSCLNWLFCRQAPAELAALVAGARLTVRL